MDEAIKAAEKLIALGRLAIQNGMWELALVRFAQAVGGLTTLFSLSQTDDLVEPLTAAEDRYLAEKIMELEKRIKGIASEWGNGHHNPPNHNLAHAAKALLKDLRKLM